MPNYTVLDTQTGKRVTFQWDGTGDPTDADMQEVFKAAHSFAPSGPPLAASHTSTVPELQPSHRKKSFGRAPEESEMVNPVSDAAVLEEAGKVAKGAVKNAGRLIHGAARTLIPGEAVAEDLITGRKKWGDIQSTDFLPGSEVAKYAADVVAGGIEHGLDLAGVRKNPYGPTPEQKVASGVVAPIKEAVKNPGQVPAKLRKYAEENPIDAAMWLTGGLGVLRAGAGRAGLSSIEALAGGAEDAVLGLGPKMVKAGKTVAGAVGIGGETPWADIVDRAIPKAIRPGVEGQRTAAKMQSYKESARSAVKSIVDNKGNLSYARDGGTVTGELPQNLPEFSEAIAQTKRGIFNQYDDMQRAAGGKGATVALGDIANELDTIAKNPAVQDWGKGAAEYAAEKASALRARGAYTAQDAQDAIAALNRSLEAFYKNPTGETATRAYVDSMVANRLRSSLDEVITSTEGPGYQALKKQYGDLKAIERDVNRRAVVDARKNIKGLIDFSDIFSAAEVIKGLSTGNVADVLAGGSARAISRWYKSINDPNNVVARMFKGVDKALQPKPNGYNFTQEGFVGPGRPENTAYRGMQGQPIDLPTIPGHTAADSARVFMSNPSQTPAADSAMFWENVTQGHRPVYVAESPSLGPKSARESARTLAAAPETAAERALAFEGPNEMLRRTPAGRSAAVFEELFQQAKTPAARAELLKGLKGKQLTYYKHLAEYLDQLDRTEASVGLGYPVPR